MDRIPTFCTIFVFNMFICSMMGHAMPRDANGGQTPLPLAPPGQCWQQKWGDEFEGTQINLAKWSVTERQVRASGLWQADHVKVHDGVLDFLVTRDDGTLVTGGISSQSHFETTYGYFEMRAKMPLAPGYRPGFWLSSARINIVGDPTHPTEIDILELPMRDGSVRQNLHWNGYSAEHQTTGTTPSHRVTLGEFHTFAVYWNRDAYRFYIDRKLSWTSKGGGISSGREFIRLGNEPFRSELLRGRQPTNDEFRKAGNFQIDYVRVYQLAPCGR